MGFNLAFKGLTLTFQNNCHPSLWTDKKIKYTERLNISTKQFSAHREYFKMTFQSYNHTGEFSRFWSSVDEVSIILGCYNMSLGDWFLKVQDTLVILQSHMTITHWNSATHSRRMEKLQPQLFHT